MARSFQELFLHRIVFLILFPFSQWAAEIAAIQFHIEFIEYAKHRTATFEPADSKNIVERMTVIVHIHDIFYCAPVLSRFVSFPAET